MGEICATSPRFCITPGRNNFGDGRAGQLDERETQRRVVHGCAVEYAPLWLASG